MTHLRAAPDAQEKLRRGVDAQPRLELFAQGADFDRLVQIGRCHALRSCDEQHPFKCLTRGKPRFLIVPRRRNTNDQWRTLHEPLVGSRRSCADVENPNRGCDKRRRKIEQSANRGAISGHAVVASSRMDPAREFPAKTRVGELGMVCLRDQLGDGLTFCTSLYESFTRPTVSRDCASDLFGPFRIYDTNRLALGMYEPLALEFREHATHRFELHPQIAADFFPRHAQIKLRG